jgi:hypothetical protein
LRILYLHDNSTEGNGPTLDELLASRECDLVVSDQIPEEGANYDFIFSPRSAAASSFDFGRFNLIAGNVATAIFRHR